MDEKGKILVVDDEKVMRNLLSKVLGKEGYEIVTAKDGAEARKVFAKSAFNLAMLDIMLPDGDGVKLLNQFKEMDPDIEGMIITGYASLDTAIKALEYGAGEYIRKPFDRIEDVIRIVNRLVEKQKLTLENKRLHEETEKQRDELKQRVFELGVLYDVSGAISYTLDYGQLFKLIMDSLSKVIDYDAAASFLLSEGGGNLVIRAPRPVSEKFSDTVIDNIIETAATLTSQPLKKEDIKIDFGEASKPEKGEDGLNDIRSFLNVPLIAKDKVIGIFNISSSRPNAFNPGDIRILYTLSNQAAVAVERLRAVIASEKSKMDAMVKSMIEGIIMTDERGEIVVLNPQARRMLGFSPDEEVVSLLWQKMLRETGLDKALEECRSDKHLIVKEIVNPQNESQIFCCDISPVTDAKENTIGIVVVVRDISKEKEVDRLKTEFISTVSHELRTPLTSMKNVVSNILAGVAGEIGGKLKRYLFMMNEDIDRLSRLINNLLDISKIEARKTEFKKTPVDINSLADNAVSTLKPEADKKHIELKAFFPASAINIYADPDKIIEIFVNLISNAIKFTPEAGKVLIEIKDKDKEVECSVVDTGQGIAPENINKLFTKFQQFDRQDGEGTKGTGLGLAITSELVKSHNGRIRAESKLGQGSKFVFTIPKYTSEDVFKEYLNNGLRKAEATNKVLSILVLHVNNFVELRDEYGAKKVHKILSDLETIVKKNVRRGFISMHKESSIVIVLEETDRKGTLVVQKRIADAIKKYKFTLATGQSIEIPVAFGIATHPEEVVIEKDMIPGPEEKPMRVKAVGKIILLVEDDKECIELTGERLKANGYKVLKAYNGEEAFKIMETQLPDLVISDSNMPVLDGLGLLKKMKKNKKLSSIPFIFLSGTKKEFEDRVTGLIHGAAHYVLKPYEAAGLLSMIKSLLKNNAVKNKGIRMRGKNG